MSQPMQTGIGSMDRPPIELPHPVRMRILGAVMIGVFLAALDQTVVGTALPRIITDLGGNDLYTWAFTAYLLTSTISGPLYGKLSDLFGRRPIFLFGIGVFMVGSLLAGLSQEMWQLVAARGVQGLGAGALFPIALAVIGDIFAPSERGRYQGLFGAVFGLSVLVGPAIGGLITDTIGWPFVFFFNLPVGAAVFAGVWRNLPQYHPAGEQAEDRLPRRGTVHRGAGPDPGRSDEQADGRLERPRRRRAHRRRRADPRRLRLRRIARRRADRAARIVPQPLVHGVGGGGVPRGDRVLRDGRVPAALVPGRGRFVRDGVGLPDAAAARRAHLQRGRVRSDREPDGPVPDAHLRCARRHVDRPVHAHPPPRRHAAPGPVGLDVRDRPRRRPDLRGLPARRPEQRRDQAARDGDQQPHVLPAVGGTVGLALTGTIFATTLAEQVPPGSARPGFRPRSGRPWLAAAVSTP